jgi:glycerol-3-phosphate dehydrogenase
MAPIVADIMMKELNKNNDWKENQIERFNKLAQNYILS